MGGSRCQDYLFFPLQMTGLDFCDEGRGGKVCCEKHPSYVAGCSYVLLNTMQSGSSTGRDTALQFG